MLPLATYTSKRLAGQLWRCLACPIISRNVRACTTVMGKQIWLPGDNITSGTYRHRIQPLIGALQVLSTSVPIVGRDHKVFSSSVVDSTDPLLVADLSSQNRVRYTRYIDRPEALDGQNKSRWSHLRKHDEKERLPPTRKSVLAKENLRDLDTLPLSILTTELSSEAADPSVIEVCLEEHFRRMRVLPESEIPGHAKKQPIASTLINYLLSKNRAWLRLVLKQHEASFWLSHCAIAEGIKDILLDWVEVDLDNTEARNILGVKHHIWRGLFSRSILTAQLLLQQNISGPRALATFFDLMQSRTDALDVLFPEGHQELPRAPDRNVTCS